MHSIAILQFQPVRKASPMPIPDPSVIPDMQQAATTGATGGLGGIIGAAITFLSVTKMFARPADVENARLEGRVNLAELRAEVAEKYVSKQAMEPVMDNLEYIRERLDKLADRHGGH